MAFDPGLAQLLRDDLAGEAITEKKMFGGLCFLSGGHMICGLHKGGTMYRVGKDSYAAALALPGVRPMLMANRPMAAMVTLSLEDSAEDAIRAPVLALALATVRALPPKVAKPAKR
ncbi:MAG: TfoX/Sxy family protein [Tabrizicola sp.]|jgi:TfoX/Sxy family transcriptional regulator of competence genes|uniref:TfoX/Sxy family protein n=1 Tax=Tabrizicola sp. TaxID=2005166 RepID=UPI003BAEE71D|nr:TfoX/Sxy family protein [Tabrizicola sp.]